LTTQHPFIGRYVIVRTYGAGVFAGTLKAHDGRKILLENSRRLWRWHTKNNGVSLSEVGQFGLNHKDSKICCVEPLQELEPIELTPASAEAQKSIESAADYIA
jgi:uncharacterized protein DUF6948